MVSAHCKAWVARQDEDYQGAPMRRRVLLTNFERMKIFRFFVPQSMGAYAHENDHSYKRVATLAIQMLVFKIN